MRVKAIAPGFFDGGRIREGQEFEVPAGTRGAWFVPLDEYRAPKPSKQRQPVTMSELAKESAAGRPDLA